MNKREFFSYYLLNAAILGNFADFYFGDVIATFLGIPVILLGKVIYFLSADLFYLGLIFFTLAAILITFAGLRVIPTERFNKLLLPKILGFLLAFFWVRTGITNFILIGLLYNFLHKLFLQYCTSRDLINVWVGDFLGLNIFWERFLLLFTVAFASGTTTNIVYNLLKLFSFVF